MAIKFVDQKPEDGKTLKKDGSTKPGLAKVVEPEPAPAEPLESGSTLPGLSYPKPEPKKRGRKKAFG